MDCFHDFCLACDKESTAGPYCSPECRAADLEKAGSSRPSSGSNSPSPKQGAWDANHSRPSRQEQNNPSWTEASYQSIQQRPTLHSTRTSPAAAATVDVPQQRSLSPSSSRSSLSSIASATSGNTGMSESARAELQDYFASFHKTRSAKRRQSTW